MEKFIDTLRGWLGDPAILRFLELGLGILVLFILFRVLARVLPSRIPDSDLRYRVRKGINLLGYIIVALFVATVFNDNLRQVTVIFGVVGAGIAFALQEIIVSFAGWVAISLGQFYKSGDRVQLGGIMGDVIDISLLRTTLMECGDWVKADLYNGRIVRIANSFVFKEPVFNYSGDFPFLWDEITIPVRYGSDYHRAKQILLEIANDVVGHHIATAQQVWSRMVQKYLIEDARVNPVVTLVATDNWLEFTVRYVVDYKLRRMTKDQLFMQILEAFDATDGQIQLASTTVEVVAHSGIQVQMPWDQKRSPAADP
ncbi:mechanosensitive ion channel family protein [Lyngbya confervoides]|uniref:Mechanosensitive ion channel family protein n=1 Tax=Lyngbya confervoides BDU141951 TaxID=1574623 RepID=A0ABD4SYX7_9CYAN|nr:mechanosensitive ion channel domain-containing protein [Lyngbya confervoides]MCM1981677.1 mechanosensitive ion channel family protein [Lyngbya confervoides BDU141951]